jgi:hypothetical protein
MKVVAQQCGPSHLVYLSKPLLLLTGDPATLENAFRAYNRTEEYELDHVLFDVAARTTTTTSISLPCGTKSRAFRPRSSLPAYAAVPTWEGHSAPLRRVVG